MALMEQRIETEAKEKEELKRKLESLEQKQQADKAELMKNQSEEVKKQLEALEQ